MNKKLLFFGFILIFGVFFVNFFNFNNNNVIAQIQDTTPPEVRVEWNLEGSYPFAIQLKIPVFSASDESDIDLENSYIKISSSKTNRTIPGQNIQTAEDMYNKYILDNTQDPGDLFFEFSYMSVYTITYYVVDIYGNSTTQNYTIKVGDLIAPTIEIEEDFINQSYNVGDTLFCDSSKIIVSDNITPSEDLDVEIELQNITTGQLCPLENYSYTFETAGEYSLIVKVTDQTGNVRTVTRTLIVEHQSPEETPLDFSVNKFMIILLASIVNPNILANYYGKKNTTLCCVFCYFY